MSLNLPLAGRPRRTLVGAKIIFNNKSSVFDCVVRRLSEDGAELRMPSTLGVPRTFHLRIGSAGKLQECEIDWRTETEIGVIFTPEQNAANVIHLNS